MSKYIVESKKFENESLAMLTKAGLGDHAEAVRDALNNMTVNGYEDGTKVVALSRTGKELIPLTKWFCSTWNNGDDMEHTLEAVADQVHRMYRMPTTKNADLVKVQAEYPTIDKLTAWLDNEAQNAKNKGSELRAKGQYNFPKEMLAYSDDKVDCYRANTPAEAMALGDGYSFCISRRDGSNMFYSYRMNPTTTAYFCWFKDENGNKTKSNMCVLHVGEDGKYMATPSQNGQAPRESAQNVIEIYPGLEGAIESGKLTVIPMSDMEKEVRRTYNPRSVVHLDDIKGKSPEYIELVLSQGVKLEDDAFDYIFRGIDRGNLRKGNSGNSLIKKYIESGVHALSKHQTQVLKEAGYENEALRAFEVYWRGRVESNMPLGDEEFEILFTDVDKGRLSKGSVIDDYIERNHFGLTDYQRDLLKKAGYGDRVDEAQRSFVKRQIELGVFVSGDTLRYAVDTFDGGDITKQDSLVNKYFVNYANQGKIQTAWNVFDKGSNNERLYYAYAFVSKYLKYFGPSSNICSCKLENGKVVVNVSYYERLDKRRYLFLRDLHEDADLVANIDVISGIEELAIEHTDFADLVKFPVIEGLNSLILEHCGDYNKNIQLSKPLSLLKIKSVFIGKWNFDFSNITSNEFYVDLGHSGATKEVPKDSYIIPPKGVTSYENRYFIQPKTVKHIPANVKNLTLYIGGDITLDGIPEHLTGNFFELKMDSIEDFKRLDHFPKKIDGSLAIDFNRYNKTDYKDIPDSMLTYDEIPECIRNCDVSRVYLSGYSIMSETKGLAKFLIEKNTGTVKLPGVDINKVVDGKRVVVPEGYRWDVGNYTKKPDTVLFTTPSTKGYKADAWLYVSEVSKLNDAPSEVGFYHNIGRYKDYYSICLYIYNSLYEELELDHDIKGVSILEIYKCKWLKRIKGVEHIKGLKEVEIYNCFNLDIKALKKQLPGVKFKVDNYKRKDESLQVGQLGRVLGALDEDDIGMAVPATTGSGTVGNGTVADAGKVPTPRLGLIKADWFKDKKKRKGLRALMSSLNKLS